MIIEQIDLPLPPSIIVKQFAILSDRTFIILAKDSSVKNSKRQFFMSHLSEKGLPIYKK